jgi:predicted TIM-barrel fold metal-dependent hydrolase
VEVLNLPLVDAHCHSVVAGDLDLPAFERWCTEADRPAPAGTSYVDSAVGLAVRRWCPPVLGLPAHAPLAEYLERRAGLGWRAATAALMRAAGLAELFVDTGLDGPGLLPWRELGGFAGATVREVVRLERVAEELTDCAAAGFADAYRTALAARVTGAVAVKSVVAYRHGLALRPERPTDAEVRRAAGGWLASPGRLTDPVLLRFVLWAGVDTGLPVQVHTGFGDRDLSLRDADPALLQPFLAAVEPAPVVLLHGYPYQRRAGWLALVYPHVSVDVGLTMTHLGTRARDALGDFLELAPFGKVLFSTDGYGLPELYTVAAAQFRAALSGLLDTWHADGALSTVDAERIAAQICAGNARRVYGTA